MFGTWEMLIIGVIIGVMAYPYLQRRGQARRKQKQQQGPVLRRKSRKPVAREVEYEEEE